MGCLIWIRNQEINYGNSKKSSGFLECSLFSMKGKNAVLALMLKDGKAYWLRCYNVTTLLKSKEKEPKPEKEVNLNILDVDINNVCYMKTRSVKKDETDGYDHFVYILIGMNKLCKVNLCLLEEKSDKRPLPETIILRPDTEVKEILRFEVSDIDGYPRILIKNSCQQKDIFKIMTFEEDHVPKFSIASQRAEDEFLSSNQISQHFGLRLTMNGGLGEKLRDVLSYTSSPFNDIKIYTKHGQAFPVSIAICDEIKVIFIDLDRNLPARSLIDLNIGIKLPIQQNLDDEATSFVPASIPLEITDNTRRNLQNLAICINSNIPVLIEGEAGGGKTAAVIYLATQTNSPLMRMNLNAFTSIQDFLGKIKVEQGKDKNSKAETIFELTTFTKAVEK